MGSYARTLLFVLMAMIMSLPLTACVIEQVPVEIVSASPTVEEADEAEETATTEPATDTPTAEAETATTEPATDTPTAEPPTETPTAEPPTAEPPTATPQPATDTPTPIPPTNTPTAVPPTATTAPTVPPAPTATATPAGTDALERFGQGLDLLDAEKWTEAIAAFQEVIASVPDFAQAYQGLGFAYLGNDEPAKAVEPLEKYLELAPDAENRAEIADLLTRLRDYLASPLANIQIPEGKGALVIQNCRGGTDTLNIDVIPVGIFVQLAPRTEQSCTRSDPIFLDPGEYDLRASIAGAPSQGAGGITITLGEASEFTWY